MDRCSCCLNRKPRYLFNHLDERDYSSTLERTALSNLNAGGVACPTYDLKICSFIQVGYLILNVKASSIDLNKDFVQNKLTNCEAETYAQVSVEI